MKDTNPAVITAKLGKPYLTLLVLGRHRQLGKLERSLHEVKIDVS